MATRSALNARLRMLLTALWGLFLVYGPVALFICVWFRWPFLALNRNLLAYIGYPALASWLCALVTVIVLLFRAPLKAILPALIFLLNWSLTFSPLNALLEVKGFATYSTPTAAYVEKHCAPMEFVQDGKTYTLGICNLIIDHKGLVDFDLIYDTSGDIGNYNSLNPTDKYTFAEAMRKYFNDDPNEDFEIGDFTAPRYYGDFYMPSFDDEYDTEGFRKAYGPPPKNPKGNYPFVFEGP